MRERQRRWRAGAALAVVGAVPALAAAPGCRRSSRQVCEAYWTRSYQCRDQWMPSYWTRDLNRPAASYRADPRPPALRARDRCATDGARRPLEPERLTCLDASSCDEMGACERAYETR